MLIERTVKHAWVESLCTCHPENCAQVVTEAGETTRIPWYDLCGKPATDQIHSRTAAPAVRR